YNSSHIAIDAGEEITILQALYAIMLQSANEVSNGVGEHISGSMEDFALLMTQRAKELGCKNTNFINANGLHDENHYTTAYDMSLIAKELLKFDFFRELMACTYYEIPPTNKQSEIRYLHGQNQLLKSSSRFYYEDCIGGKTGFTDQAGNTLVSYAKRGDTELISVVLKSTGYGYYEDTAKIFDYGFNNFETCTLITQGDIGGVVSVTETGKKETLERGTINGMYSEGLVVTLPKDTPLSSITSTNDLQQTMEAPVKKGETLATTTFTLNNKTLGTISLVADKTIDIEPVIEDNNFFDSILSVRTMLLSLSIISLIIVVIRTLITANANKKRRKYRKLRQRKSSKYPH
ncbi:MAG: D-alanyl-D-alanine carboxypeptidase family protein, partial [Anaerotignaceae bacterium]